QSLPHGAESAGQAIILGIEGLLEGGGRLSPQLAEAINFYYDPEIPFDSWLAFTSSFRRYLRQMSEDLKALNVDAELISSTELLIGQLEILYPVRETELIQEEEPAPEPQQQQNLLWIDEAESQRISNLLYELLNISESDDEIFLKPI